MLTRVTSRSILTIFLLLVLVGFAAAGAPGGSVVGTDDRMPYLVVLKDQPDSGTSYAMMKAQAASSQATVLSSISAIDRATAQSAEQFWIVNAIAIEADDETIERIALLPGVDHVEPVMWVQVDDPVYAVSDSVDAQYVRSSEEFFLPWHLDWIESPAVWGAGNRGEGVTIAVVDTGIDGSHPAFGGRVKAFADFVGEEQNVSAYDDNGHGTHCAGTAAGGEVVVSSYSGEYNVLLGVAPGADLIGAKVLNSAGSGTTSAILKGIEWSVENGADVISLSVGSYYLDKNATSIEIWPGETVSLTLDVSSNIDLLYECQYVIGGYTLPEMGMAVAVSPYESEPANLSMALYAPGMTPAVGGYIDWDGFDHRSNRVMFKAPYANNSANWPGIWTLQITNNGNGTVWLDDARIAAAYQSNGETAYDQALNNLANEGVVAVVAAGNAGYYGTGTIGTPGTAQDVITVGATDYCMDYRATFSSIGPVNRTSPYVKPDLMAPGVGIVSAYPNGQYAVMDGTSMATPGVAGAVALMLAGNDTLTPAQVKETLMDTAVHIREDGTALATPELNNLYGAGRINAYRAVEATGGLHGTAPSPYLTELLGGSSYDASADLNHVKMLAVCWNATAGAPMAGETVSFSVYRSGTDPINTTGVTDVNGMATATVDISNFPENDYFYTETTWDGRTLSGSHNKGVQSGGVQAVEPIFFTQDFLVATNGSLTIRYPLLKADGSAYTEPVRLQVTNGTPFFDANLTPVDGVVEATIDFSKFNVNPDGRSPDVMIDGRRAGFISFSYWSHTEAFSSPKMAICPPGGSIGIALQVAEGHGGYVTGETVTSKDYDVYVTAFTETQILSLPSEISGPLAAGMPVDDAALIEATGGMKPEEFVGTVEVRNGIGIYDFEMPEGCYVAVVKFADPDEFEGYYDSFMVSVVYGSMSPWTLHRVTPTVPVALNTVDSTHIDIYGFDWPATWDQEHYRSVPGDGATLTAIVYTHNGTTETETPQAGKTVWLYTADGVQTNTTGADGTCTFTLDVAGKTLEDVILITEGITTYGRADTSNPLYPTDLSRLRPGILSGGQQAAAAIWRFSPASEYRWMDVDYQSSGAYMVTLHSYGPDDEAIVERGVFTGDPLLGWHSLGTEFASTLAYTGTCAMNLTPSRDGTYEATAGILIPGTGSFNYMIRDFAVPGACVDYTVKRDVLAGETVPVTFTVTKNDGTPISGAKVGFFLGGAVTFDYGVYDDEVRPLNILHMANTNPDPYSEVLAGYTNPNGQVTLTFHAPSAAMMPYRQELGFSDYVEYRVACYKDDKVLKGGSVWEGCDGAFMLTTAALPDFVPSVQAPHVVKLYHNDSITVECLTLSVTNQGTADFVHTDRDIEFRASVGSKSISAPSYTGNLAVGETKNSFRGSISGVASDFGIDPSDYKLPVDTNVDLIVNPNRTIEEISYANNQIIYPVRITAPDLAAEIVAPSIVIQTGTATPIALAVTNRGEVPAVATTMTYLAPGSPIETIDVPALAPGESYSVWRNQTLLASPGTYTFTLEVNPNGATDHETTFENNKVTRTVHCYLHPSTSIVLPQELVLVPGTTYDLPIVVNGAENLALFAMTFTFDPAVVTVTDVTGGDLGAVLANLNHVNEGYVRFDNCQGTDFSGNVTVATIHLRALGSSGAETALGLVDVELIGADEYAIPVEVTAGSAVLLLYGDANGDGVVNQADTLRVLRWVVGLDPAKPVGGSTAFLRTDVTKNSAIDVGDAMFIAQKNVDLRDPYFRIR